MNIVEKFRGDYFFLSNFYPCEIDYNNNHFYSSEAAYMSRKNNSASWLKLCTTTKDPSVIKKASHYIYIIKTWPTIKLSVMEEVLRVKFAIPKLAEKLIATGDMELQEGNDWNDDFWGVDIITKIGENNLGKILMKIREDIR